MFYCFVSDICSLEKNPTLFVKIFKIEDKKIVFILKKRWESATPA